MIGNINGTKIFYEVSGDGLPVVFVHGLGGTGNVWNAQRVGLSKFFKVITIDLPGSGQSEKSQREYSVEKWVDEIAALTQTIGLDRFVLVGHSMTTVVAQKFAALHGDRLRALVLCGPLTELAPPAKEAFTKRAETIERDGMIAVVDGIL